LLDGEDFLFGTHKIYTSIHIYIHGYGLGII
jgi:hypothetical protein